MLPIIVPEFTVWSSHHDLSRWSFIDLYDNILSWNKFFIYILVTVKCTVDSSNASQNRIEMLAIYYRVLKSHPDFVYCVILSNDEMSTQSNGQYRPYAIKVTATFSSNILQNDKGIQVILFKFTLLNGYRVNMTHGNSLYRKLMMLCKRKSTDPISSKICVLFRHRRKLHCTRVLNYSY